MARPRRTRKRTFTRSSRLRETPPSRPPAGQSPTRPAPSRPTRHDLCASPPASWQSRSEPPDRGRITRCLQRSRLSRSTIRAAIGCHMQHRTGDLDLDHPGLHHRSNRRGRGSRLHRQRHESGPIRAGQDQLAPDAPTRAIAKDAARSTHASTPHRRLRRHITDPSARQTALGHNPGLHIVRPTPPTRRPIQNPDPQHSPTTANLHSMLNLVLQCKPPAKLICTTA